MEVFSLKTENDGEKVTGQGVVYCEMKGRQHSEADLLDFNLRKELCSRYESQNPILSRFKWECGGLTQDIATLSLEEITTFHRCFYNPSNISIIICGKLNDDSEAELLNLIGSVLKPSECYNSSEKFVSDPLKNDSIASQSRIVHFPSNEDNLGSVGLAWLGAHAKDLTKVLSFHVLFKYLRETSSSPLYQRFVQIETPWATDIDYEIKPLFQTFMTLIFSGVPHRPDCDDENGLVPGKISSLLKETLISLSEDIDHLKQMIKFCLCSFELKLIELIEDDPYETIVSYTVPELIVSAIDDSASSNFGNCILNLKAVIAELKTKPVNYWLRLLNELIEVDPVEVIMIPDTKLNDKIEEEEQLYLSELLHSGRARVSQIPEITSYNIRGDFELMTDSQPTPYKHVVKSNGLHVVELPGTGMKQIIRLVNFKTIIPERLWKTLVLFQELLFQCDVDLSMNPSVKSILSCDSDKISYQMLQKTLNSMLNSYGINFGLDNDTFSLGYCEEALSWTVTLPSSSTLTLVDCLGILEIVATCSIFTAERIKIVAENLYNQIQDLQKDPYEVIESILTVSLHDLNHQQSSRNIQKKAKLEASDKIFETVISMFNKKGFLKSISRGETAFIEEILNDLNEIKSCLRNGLKSPSFVQIGSKLEIVQQEAKNIKEEFDMKSGRNNFDVSMLPKFGKVEMESACGIAYAIGDITASYMSFVVPCEVLPSKCENCSSEEAIINEYVSVSLICQLLSVTEGPIYSAIRGRGLAYDASLTVALWNGLLTFAVNDSNDPVTAFKEFKKLMGSVDQEFRTEEWNVISEDSLKVAKSAFLYQMIEESSTPSSMFNCCFKNHLRSIPMASGSEEVDPIKEMIRKVTRADLSRAWFKYFVKLIIGQALTVLVVPKSISTAIINQFSGLIDFDIKTFNDFSGNSESQSKSESDSDSGSEDYSDEESGESDESDESYGSDSDE